MDANSDSNLGVSSRSSTCALCHRILSSDNETGDLEAISVCGDCKFLLLEDIGITSPEMHQTRAPASRRRFRYSSSESIESIFSQQFSQIITLARPNQSNVSDHDTQSIDGEGAARLVQQSSSRTTPSGSRRFRRVFSDNDSVSDGFDSLYGETEGFRRYPTFHGEADTISNSLYDGDSDVSADGQSIFGNENFGRMNGGSELETDTDIDPMNAGRYPWNSENDEEENDSEWEETDVEVNPQESLRAVVAQFRGLSRSNYRNGDDYRRRQSLSPEIEGGLPFRVRGRRIISGMRELIARSRVRDSADYLDARGFENFLEHLADAGAENSRRGVPPASMSFVNNMPCITISEKDLASMMMACAICKDSFIVGVVAKQLPCSHLYHPACIHPWLSVRNTCPLCRYELPTDDYDYEARKRNSEAARGNEYMTHNVNDDSNSSSDATYDDDDDDDDDAIVVVDEPSQQAERIDAADSSGESRSAPGDGAIPRNGWFFAAAAPIISILGMSLIMWFQTNRRCQLSHIPHRREYNAQKRWWWQQLYF